MSLEKTKDFIEQYCDFSGDNCYYLMAIARRAENEGITNSSETIFREVLYKEDHIEYKLRKLWTLAENFEIDGKNLTFRLYMSINPRSAIDTFFDFLSDQMNMARHLYYEDSGTERRISNLANSWKSTLQEPQNRAEKNFLFDIDMSAELDDELIDAIDGDDGRIKEIIATPNGWHIISETFNYNEIDLPEEAELKTDAMLFLEKFN